MPRSERILTIRSLWSGAMWAPDQSRAPGTSSWLTSNGRRALKLWPLKQAPLITGHQRVNALTDLAGSRDPHLILVIEHMLDHLPKPARPAGFDPTTPWFVVAKVKTAGC